MHESASRLWFIVVGSHAWNTTGTRAEEQRRTYCSVVGIVTLYPESTNHERCTECGNTFEHEEVKNHGTTRKISRSRRCAWWTTSIIPKTERCIGKVISISICCRQSFQAMYDGIWRSVLSCAVSGGFTNDEIVCMYHHQLWETDLLVMEKQRKRTSLTIEALSRTISKPFISSVFHVRTIRP